MVCDPTLNSGSRSNLVGSLLWSAAIGRFDGPRAQVGVDRVLQFQFDFNDQEAVVVTNPMLAVVPAYPVAAPRPVEQESSS